jgi:hypothetical protein
MGMAAAADGCYYKGGMAVVLQALVKSLRKE